MPSSRVGARTIRPSLRSRVASLSKAITAVCTTTLIREGKLRFDTPLGEILARAPARYPEPRDGRLRAATIAQLLTHRSGFGRSEASDPATGRTLADVLLERRRYVEVERVYVEATGAEYDAAVMVNLAMGGVR